ncbi:MAG: HDOD domain-containing protein [Gemmatimonadetes bacterium]|nr:HDOD domain-containing protein [Gemmatimonadota bacterium]
MSRILFVDDDPAVLQGLRRMLRSMRDEWDMSFAESGERGLELFAENPFDIVVSDMRMPGMDGATFLRRVQELYPNTLRIILSGYAGREAILRAIGPTHQFLTKPCNPAQLRATIQRLLGLKALMGSPRLDAFVVKLDRIPSVPALYRQVVDEIRNPNCSLARVGELVSKDAAMSAEILKVVNSAYFGLANPMTTAERAVTMLGLEITSSLILGVSIFTEFDLPCEFPLHDIWHTSLTVASTAREISRAEGRSREEADLAFMAGVLHRIGQLVFAVNAACEYRKVLDAVDEGQPLTSSEHTIFGTSHCEVGGYLLGLWAMQDDLVEAVAFREVPLADAAEMGRIRGILHVASVLVAGTAAELESLRLELETVGLAARLPAWSEIVRSAGHEITPSP